MPLQTEWRTVAVSSLDDVEVETSLSDNADETTLENACAICFEERDDFATLPCQCKIQYCSQCWDRSLAMSFARVGHPQCPSCRSPFTADLDEQTGQLVFSPCKEGEKVADWRPRLYSKTKPVQIRLLQKFGCCEEDLTKVDSIDRLCERMASRRPSCDSSSSSFQVEIPEEHGPACACGAHLQLVSSRKRLELMLDEMASDWRRRPGVDVDKLIKKLMKSKVIICDLCSESATTSGAVWTCSNGPRTILHATGYDICEACFKKYAGVACRLGECGQSKAELSSVRSNGTDRWKGRRTPPLMAAAKVAISKGVRSLMYRSSAQPQIHLQGLGTIQIPSPRSDRVIESL